MDPTTLRIITEVCLGAEDRKTGVEILWDLLTAFGITEEIALEQLRDLKENTGGWVTKQIKSNYDRRKHL